MSNWCLSLTVRDHVAVAAAPVAVAVWLGTPLPPVCPDVAPCRDAVAVQCDRDDVRRANVALLSLHAHDAA